MKKYLIFGITGQDGSYLADFLIKRRIVHGVKRRSSFTRSNRSYHQDFKKKKVFTTCDINDSISVSSIKVKPDEIYNLAAQSHVAVSLKFQNIQQMQMLLLPRILDNKVLWNAKKKILSSRNF